MGPNVSSSCGNSSGLVMLSNHILPVLESKVLSAEFSWAVDTTDRLWYVVHCWRNDIQQPGNRSSVGAAIHCKRGDVSEAKCGKSVLALNRARTCGAAGIYKESQPAFFFPTFCCFSSLCFTTFPHSGFLLMLCL